MPGMFNGHGCCVISDRGPKGGPGTVGPAAEETGAEGTSSVGIGERTGGGGGDDIA